MMKRLLPLALSGLAGYALWQWQSHCTRQRLKSVSAKPEEVTTWEGEGGALHRTGPHMNSQRTGGSASTGAY